MGDGRSGLLPRPIAILKGDDSVLKQIPANQFRILLPTCGFPTPLRFPFGDKQGQYREPLGGFRRYAGYFIAASPRRFR